MVPVSIGSYSDDTSSHNIVLSNFKTVVCAGPFSVSGISMPLVLDFLEDVVQFLLELFAFRVVGFEGYVSAKVVQFVQSHHHRFVSRCRTKDDLVFFVEAHHVIEDQLPFGRCEFQGNFLAGLDAFLPGHRFASMRERVPEVGRHSTGS